MKEIVVFLTGSQLARCYFSRMSIAFLVFSIVSKDKIKEWKWFLLLILFLFIHSHHFLLYLTMLSIAIPIPHARLFECKVYSIEQSVTHSKILWIFLMNNLKNTCKERMYWGLDFTVMIFVKSNRDELMQSLRSLPHSCTELTDLLKFLTKRVVESR